MSIALMHRKPSYEELEEEIIQLKEELGFRVSLDRVDKLRERLGLTPGESKVVLALYDTKSRILPKATLNLIGNKHDNVDMDGSNSATRIRCIRKAMGEDFIQTHWGLGYTLSPSGRDTVRSALDD